MIRKCMIGGCFERRVQGSDYCAECKANRIANGMDKPDAPAAAAAPSQPTSALRRLWQRVCCRFGFHNDPHQASDLVYESTRDARRTRTLQYCGTCYTAWFGPLCVEERLVKHGS